MIVSACRLPSLRLVPLLAVPALGLVLAGCAGMSDNMSTAFADPAKYDLYDCKQLETERQNLAKRSAELQGLMAKAETGTGGAVVSELAYRNDYIAVRGQTQLAEEAWQRNKCQETPAEPPAAAKGKPKPKVPKVAVKPVEEPVSTLPRDGSAYRRPER